MSRELFARDLYQRITLGAVGQPDRVELVPGPDAWKPVLSRALVLLGQARRVLDQVVDDRADIAPIVRERAEKVTDAIAALIGHPITDQEQAPELNALLAAYPLPGAGFSIDPEPDADDLQTVHPAMVTPDTCDGSLRHYFGPKDRPVAAMFDADGHPPNCPAYREPMHAAHWAAQEGHACIIDGERWPCDEEMSRRDRELRESAARTETPVSAASPQQIAHLIRGGADDDDHARRAYRRLVAAFGSDAKVPHNEVIGAIAATRQDTKLSEPAAPVEETPAARARRLDEERNEAGAAYRRAIQAADAAWREIGGRP